MATFFRHDRLSFLLDAATAVDRHVWIADADYELVEAQESHRVVGGASAAIMLEVCGSGVAPGSGTDMLASAFDLTLGVDTPRKATLHATQGNRVIKKDQQLAFDASGTMTGLAGCNISLVFKRLRA